MEKTKQCSRCKQFKGLSEFYADKRSRTGLAYRCKRCQKELSQSWWGRNGKAAYHRHAEYQKAWKNRHKDRRARIASYGHARRKYGITADQYAEMLLQQAGRCAICGSYCVELDVDHCHSSGHIRKLLCNPCNRGLAAFRDNPDIMRRAAEYLETHNGPKV